MCSKNAQNNILSKINKPCFEYSRLKNNNNIVLNTISLRLIFILYITLNFSLINLSYCQNELAENLNKEFAKLALTYPSGWENYFKNINSRSQIKLDKFKLKDFDYRLNKIHRFNPQVISNFQSIIWEEYTIFKTFSFSIKETKSDFSEYIGAGRIINDLVEIAYFQIDTTSNLKPVFKEVEKTNSKKVFFNTKYEKVIEKQIRKYNLEENELILQTLKARSYEELHRATKNIITALQTKEFVISENSPYYSENGKFLFLVQEDGNMVIYRTDTKPGEDAMAIWDIGTFREGRRPYLFVIEKNGSLILYDSDWKQIWAHMIEKKVYPPIRLVLSNEGILKFIDSKNNIICGSGNTPIKIDE